MSRAAQWARTCGDANLITSVGSAATQTVFHLHVHVVPRRAGDGLALPWTSQKADADA
jgi:histidine triad (HIT) family protein